MVLLDGDRGTRPRKGNKVSKGAAFVHGGKDAERDARELEGEELARLHGFREVADGAAVGKPEGVGGIEDEAVALGDANLFSVVLEEQRLRGILRFAGVVNDGGGEKFGEEHAAVRRPAKRVDDVAERLVAAREFLAFENAAALAASVLNPDVVVFEVVEFGFEVAVDGEDDAAVGRVGKGGDFLVDGLDWFVEILRTA